MPQPQESVLKFDPSITLDYIMGNFDAANHPLFVPIDVNYADRSGLYLRKEAMIAFENMWSHAKKDGIKLVIKSATRNFEYQKGIWENKWTGRTILSDNINASTIQSDKERAKKILLYSAMPGTSRHHWGTDIDLNNFNNEWFAKGEGLALYNWLTENANKYGFCQVYTAKDAERPNGYEEEKWHWSYLPLSKIFTEYARQNLKNEMIQGFFGSDSAVEIDMLQNYVLGIHPSCAI
jgi:LAS superfamily LD-carboxypeptidase LdcB